MLHRLIAVLAALVVTAAVAGVARGAGGPGGGTAQVPEGWDCAPIQLIGGYFHCAPPGKPSIADLLGGTVNVSSMVLRAFTPEGVFAGIEVLIRQDLYASQPCPQDSLVVWDFLPFSAGYYACHRFDT
jgi:hypothetical protein